MVAQQVVQHAVFAQRHALPTGVVVLRRHRRPGQRYIIPGDPAAVQIVVQLEAHVSRVGGGGEIAALFGPARRDGAALVWIGITQRGVVGGACPADSRGNSRPAASTYRRFPRCLSPRAARRSRDRSCWAAPPARASSGSHRRGC